MERKDLKVYSDDYIHNVVEEQIGEDSCWRGKFILEKDAAAVMDAQEQRIKQLEKELEDTKYKMGAANDALGMKNYQLNIRIKELEALKAPTP